MLMCAYIKLKHSTNLSKGFDAGNETTTAYVEALAISIVGFSFEN